MGTSWCLTAFGRTLRTCYNSIGKVTSTKVTWKSPVGSIPIDAPKPAHSIWIAIVKPIILGSRARFEPASASIQSSPRVMRTSSCLLTFNSTIWFCCHRIWQIFSIKVTSDPFVIGIPVNWIDSTNVVSFRDGNGIRFLDRSILHPTGASVVRVPGVVGTSGL